MPNAARALALAAAGAVATVLAQAPDGRELFLRPEKGHCIACHRLPAADTPPGIHPDIGPALEGARMRSLGKPALRDLLDDPMRANPDTTMPPFGRHRILDESEIDRVIDFLWALPPANSASGSTTGTAESPEAAIVEDGLAPAALLEEGRAFWTRKFRNGRTLAGCFPNGGRRVAASYPQYDPRLKRVVTLETAINQCLKTHGEPLLDADDPAAMGALIAYVRSLSAKQKVAVRVPQAAEPRLAEGRRLYYTRLGQRNFACASCHVQSAEKRYDGLPIADAKGQAARAPGIRDARAFTLQAMMRECFERMGAAPFPPASEEMNNLEYFLTWLSNGLALRPNVTRPR